MREPLPIIASRANALVKKYRETIAGKIATHFLLEGVRFLEEAVKGKLPVETAICDPKFAQKPRGRELLASLRAAGVEVSEATAEVFAAVSDTETPQGIVALANRPTQSVEDLLAIEEKPFLLVAAGVSDPGNLGSLIRTADAAGATGVVVAEGSVSPFNPKCVRATMGSILHLPVVEKVPLASILESFRARGVRAVATDPHAGIEFRDADYSGPVALCLGGEASGIPEEMKKAASLTVRIRLQHEVESLNVAAAGAILLFEIAEQRGKPEQRGKQGA